MKKAILSKFVVAAFTLAVVMAASSNAFGAATIVIQNADPAGAGFNDATPVNPVGNNTGTTLGQQRLNAFQFAANLWGATISSNVTITIKATWEPLQCTDTSATLGSAGASSIWVNFPNRPVADTWYPAALANALSGQDLDTANPEIRARFNSSLGNTGCLTGTHFYLGLDNNHGADVDLVSVLTHEFAHGLGFQSFTDASTGAEATDRNGVNALPSIFDRFLLDDTTGKTWVQMTDAERKASAVNTNNLVWNGANVDNDLRGVLGTPRLHVNAPAGIAGNYNVGTADFGPHVSAGGTTGTVVLAQDPSDSNGASTTDGCSPLTNAAAISGHIAVIDRGTCPFVTKVKNAQNAGAIGVIIVNVTTSGVIQMGGGDATISIPSLMISGADGVTVKGQLGAGVSATLLLDNSTLGGVDASGRALMFAPSPEQDGSSVSHWDTSLFPNQLMEPNISGDLIHSVAVPADLTGSQLRDIGWQFNPIGDVNFFVRQHYLDFLNRPPDTSGQQFWTNDIFGCGVNTQCADVHRINTSAAFFLSIEFQGTGNLVYKMYKSGFGNLAGKPVAVQRTDFNTDTQRIQSTPNHIIVGQGDWQNQLEANKQAFALNFVQRAGFQAAHGSQDAATYVNSLFANAGVTPTAAETSNAVAAFNNAGGGDAGRAAALRSVADSASVSNALKNESFVLMQYFGYLQRDPDAVGFDGQADPTFSGYNFWLGKLNQFGGDFVKAEMVKAFITSIEYRQRFGPA